ncbi:MAG: hypothetical protein PHR25_06515, partial [Clostridia bacterium]|nr:hypothetical protein [Clostridia bacterium]
MRAIKTTAILLWVFIFIVAAFIVGQYLSTKEIYSMFKEKEIANEQEIETEKEEKVIDKIGEETIRIGSNIAKEYFTKQYSDFVTIVVAEDVFEKQIKKDITEEIATNYVMKAIAVSMDEDKYNQVAGSSGERAIILESEVNKFIDQMFNKNVLEEIKTSEKAGYNSIDKTYGIERETQLTGYNVELASISNITSNKLKLDFIVKDKSKN